MDKKTHWRTPDKTDFLGACDLEEGKDLHLTIAKVEVKEVKVRGVKGVFRIATFKENIKPMILNVGNAKMVKMFAKNDPFVENWVNIPVTIYVQDNVKFGSEITEALRIRGAQPRIEKEELTPEKTAKWQNAIKALLDGKLISDIEAVYKISQQNKNLLIDASI